MPAAFDPDRDLFALIAEEAAVRERAVALDDTGDRAAAAALYDRANELDKMIRASRAHTIAGVLALLDYAHPYAGEAAIESLRDIERRR